MTGEDTTICGCWYVRNRQKQYIPQVSLKSQTRILSTISRTTLRQTFTCADDNDIAELSYTFPLYDGVSIVAFKCSIGEHTITGVVKERSQAEKDYQTAKKRGQTAGKLEQSVDAADVFTTSLGNVPAGSVLLVEITYVGELKNDAETDAARFTIPQIIAPRYGTTAPSHPSRTGRTHRTNQGMDIVVDIVLEEGVVVRSIQCPGQSATVTLGRTSDTVNRDSFATNLASVDLSTSRTSLDKDFIILIQAKGQDTPRALLETHPSLPNQRAVRATLIPRFNLPNQDREVVFVVDRSGSMEGKMQLVVDALQVFLRSLPIGVKFNICSFGSYHNFLFDKSEIYSDDSLHEATSYVARLDATYRGTEMLAPIQDTLSRRDSDRPLEVMLLTDGEVWNQHNLFDIVQTASMSNARFFTLGIGSGASSSLVEGIARAGRGFAQWVADGERIDRRVIRMLKGALTPHIDYKVLVKYKMHHDGLSEDEYELVESFERSLRSVTNNNTPYTTTPKARKTVSLFDPSADGDDSDGEMDRYGNLPRISVPEVLQVPHVLPELYPHSRTSVYLLLGPDTQDKDPESITIKGTCGDTDLELEIRIQDVGCGETIHQLAAKKAMQELEEGRGWVEKIPTADGSTLKTRLPSRWNLIVEREAVRLGTTFQIAGKFCSFVAIDNRDGSIRGRTNQSTAGSDGIAASASPGVSSTSLRSRQAPTLPAYSANPPFGTRFLQQAVGAVSSPAPAQCARKAGPVDSFLFYAGRSSSSARNAQSPFSPPPPPQPPSPAMRAAVDDYDDSEQVVYSRAIKTTTAQMSRPSRPAVQAITTESTDRRKSNSSSADTKTQIRQQTSPTSPTTITQSKIQQMHDLLSLQESTGSWFPSKQFWITILPSLKREYTNHDRVRVQIVKYLNLTNQTFEPDDEDKIIATFLAISWLGMIVPEEEEVWTLIAEKAEKWLEKRIYRTTRRDTIDVDQAIELSRQLWNEE